MGGRGLRSLLTIAASATLLLAPSQATADGLPILGVDASRSGLADGSGSRYVTLASGRDTVVARIEIRGGAIANSQLLRGRLTIPAVAYDGSASGLSADGRTLVLVRPRTVFPQRRTTFSVIDTRSLRAREAIVLRGDFSFDAISPDGSTAYLIHYLSRRDPTRYEVRALDLAAGRLLPGPIVDPSEPDERMAGLPLSRAASPDGRWVYTLYDGSGHEPFVHALDTVGRRAVCIDLPQLEGRRNLFTFSLRTEREGRELVVLNGKPASSGSEPLLSVDTESFEVVEPSRGAAEANGDRPWLPIGLASAAFALGVAWVAGKGRRGSARKRPQHA